MARAVKHREKFFNIDDLGEVSVLNAINTPEFDDWSICDKCKNVVATGFISPESFSSFISLSICVLAGYTPNASFKNTTWRRRG